MPLTRIEPAAIADTRGVNFRNIIINGDMSVAQRSTSESSVSSINGYNTVDRMRPRVNGIGTWTMSQDTDTPSGQGFANSFKMDCTAATASPTAGASLMFRQRIEGQMLQYLKKGTANAESVTLSFWVKSNKTGTYTAEIVDVDNNRHISKTYTIDSASTWEKKTITYDGDTTGTLDNNNQYSFELVLWLGAGSNFTSGTLNTSWNTVVNANRVSSSQVNLGDSDSNEWYITGLQLEAGTIASDFEFLPVDVNLQRCLRYYEFIASDTPIPITNATIYSSTRAYGVIYYTEKRATPSLDQTTGASLYKVFNNGSNDPFDSFTLENSNKTRGRLYNTDTISATAGHSGWFATNNASAYIAFDAEL